MSRPEGGRLTTLAALVSVAQLAQVAVSTTDVALMGTLGVRQVAAGGLAMLLFNQIRSLCVGLVTATENHVAAAAGRDEKQGIPAVFDLREVMRSSLLIATAAGGAGALLLIGLGWTLRWLGQDPQVLAAARPMMTALAPGIVPYLWFQTLRLYSVGRQRPQAQALVALGWVVVNAALATVLMHGWGFVPALGLPGLGVSTSIGYLLATVALWSVLRHDRELGAALSIRILPAPRAMVRTYLRVGVPISLTFGSEAGIFSVLGLLVGTFGPAVLAAHNVVSQIVYIVLQIATGLAHSASTLISSALGGENPSRASALVRSAVRCATVAPALSALLYVAAPGLVLRPFLTAADPEGAAALATAHTLLAVAAVLQFFDAGQTLGVGMLRGEGRTALAFGLSSTGYWLVALPAALLLAFPLHLGVAGVWWGLTAGLATAATLMIRSTLLRLGPVNSAARVALS
ncbi:MATE family efflux transporter [Nocardia sp. NPDC051570]|uniref:MATE family efflux transporter n=1 Tax=Nocardia sp. NPDC051570 TaxID=3364324 RepID=UPI0037B561D1